MKLIIYFNTIYIVITLFLKITNSSLTNYQLPAKEGSENKSLAEQPSISDNNKDDLNRAFNLMIQKNITDDDKINLKRSFGLMNQTVTVKYSNNIFSRR